MTRASLLVLAAAAAAAHAPVTTAAANVAYRIDAARSRATIHVGKAGAFSFLAGHTHEVGGPIQVGLLAVDLEEPTRSRVELIIPAAGLKVAAEREPEGDAPKVQETMESEKVLDIAHHPQITYESSVVTLKDRRGSVMNLNVAGQLTIRGVVRDVTAPVRVELGADELAATGRFTIRQSAFGIKPISVGGVVSVKDALDIEFSIVARR